MVNLSAAQRYTFDPTNKTISQKRIPPNKLLINQPDSQPTNQLTHQASQQQKVYTVWRQQPSKYSLWYWWIVKPIPLYIFKISSMGFKQGGEREKFCWNGCHFSLYTYMCVHVYSLVWMILCRLRLQLIVSIVNMCWLCVHRFCKCLGLTRDGAR